MRTVVMLVLTLAACTDSNSTQDQLDHLRQASSYCWSYDCPAVHPGSPPEVSAEDGATCMNAALTSGATAGAMWIVGDFHTNTTDYTYVFTVDHEVQIFEQSEFSAEPLDQPIRRTCATASFHAGSTLCFAFAFPSGAGDLVPVPGLEWDGC